MTQEEMTVRPELPIIKWCKINGPGNLLARNTDTICVLGAAVLAGGQRRWGKRRSSFSMPGSARYLLNDVGKSQNFSDAPQFPPIMWYYQWLSP